MVSMKKKADVPLDSIRHKDKRTNIPTEELRDFVTDDEKAPKTIHYPRDLSLDPQLVWTGKDEQDSHDLEVPSVPVYIQEKIHPQAIIEQVRANAKQEQMAQMSLFSDFNGIEFQDLIEFYQHEQNWTNRMILGDSLLIMTSLDEKEALKGKVQMIYLDPPYGIKFASNWQMSTKKREVKDGRAEDLTRQPEQIKAFRDTWSLGIHSYLSYLRDRLVITRELLADSGSVFVQIGSDNVHLVRSLLDEVFGADNYISTISFVKTSSSTGNYLPTTYDFLLLYAKNREQMKYRQLYLDKIPGDRGGSGYTRVRLPDGAQQSLKKSTRDGSDSLPSGSRIYAIGDLTSQSMGREKGEGAACWFPVSVFGNSYLPSTKTRWKTNESGMANLLKANRIEPGGKTIGYVRYLDDFPAFPVSDLWDDVMASFMADKVYVVQTSTKVVERCILMTTDPGDIVLDPTCGSGTTAYVAEQWGRRWITTDTSRVALTIARTRLMAARYLYYKLADKVDGDIRKGFDYKTLPHITLKSIATNGDIAEIDTWYEQQIAAALGELNTALHQSWAEWEAPKQASPEWPDQAKKAHADWQRLVHQRQCEIDQSIRANGENEVLYDQPYEDNRRIRVSGPFTVESLSPYRVLSTDEDRPQAESEAQKDSADVQFESMILDNLRKAGVQNMVKNERITFERLDSYAGRYLQAAGEYTDRDGKVRRVVVCIGPQYDTVSSDLIKDAARETLSDRGEDAGGQLFDLLILCGFAFEPNVSEEIKKYRKLTILTARMNADLMMGEDLLKKTGSANLFTVFGEPDIDVLTNQDGKLIVSIKGVDVYDPTTGQVRSDSPDDIACWFVDTNYNEESFFVRHAYFTGADDPYGKLKKALRAEIDEAAWSQLYSTESYPFDPPTTGKIAVKVINNYGDEVLKVYEVAL
jgi:adenine-specific DNA-methyltransferase